MFGAWCADWNEISLVRGLIRFYVRFRIDILIILSSQSMTRPAGDFLFVVFAPVKTLDGNRCDFISLEIVPN